MTAMRAEADRVPEVLETLEAGASLVEQAREFARGIGEERD